MNNSIYSFLLLVCVSWFSGLQDQLLPLAKIMPLFLLPSGPLSLLSTALVSPLDQWYVSRCCICPVLRSVPFVLSLSTLLTH
jgi:hypothetical protein